MDYTIDQCVVSLKNMTPLSPLSHFDNAIAVSIMLLPQTFDNDALKPSDAQENYGYKPFSFNVKVQTVNYR